MRSCLGKRSGRPCQKALGRGRLAEQEWGRASGSGRGGAVGKVERNDDGDGISRQPRRHGQDENRLDPRHDKRRYGIDRLGGVRAIVFAVRNRAAIPTVAGYCGNRFLGGFVLPETLGL